MVCLSLFLFVRVRCWVRSLGSRGFLVVVVVVVVWVVIIIVLLLRKKKMSLLLQGK